MFENETRVLVVLPSESVDRARGLAGRSTVSMKLPVSVQIVVRALIEEGLKHPGNPALLANIRRQADTVRRIRSDARRRPGPSPSVRVRAGSGSRVGA